MPKSGTIRLKLLKIGARLKITVRKVWLSFSETYPYQSEFCADLPQSQLLSALGIAGIIYFAFASLPESRIGNR